MGEGTKDRPGINHMIASLHRATWNSYTNKRCLKEKYKNNTGAPTVKGEGVKFDTAEDNAVILNGSLEDECVGVFAEDGVADGEIAEIITYGSVQYRLKDATLSASGNWVGCSNVAGRFDATNASPVPARHYEEAGHCSETKVAGTDVLAEGTMHFN